MNFEDVFRLVFVYPSRVQLSFTNSETSSEGLATRYVIITVACIRHTRVCIYYIYYYNVKAVDSFRFATLKLDLTDRYVDYVDQDF